jgi:histidinol-phosphatase (PHP family)
MITSDFHSHISYSSAVRMIQAAQQRGLHIFGLSEHDSQIAEMHATLSHIALEGELLNLADYMEAVRSAAQKLQFDARLGLEVDFIPAKNGTIQALLQGQPWDFLIGSVHEVDGELFESDGLRWSQEEGQARWLRYVELLREAVKSGYFSLVSHPVRMYRRNKHLPPTLDEELEKLAAASAASNVALELNGYDMLHYPDLVRRLARACALHHTPISVGSDAHRPGEVAWAHKQTAALLREVGITRVRTWKQGVIEEYHI